jgi:Chlorophyll A-B binding protein.
MGTVGLILAGEFLTMLRGYKNPFVDGSPSAFKLRDDYQAGANMGFHLADRWSDGKFAHYSNKELNNGRLAMIASLGMIVQELVTDSTLF